MSRRIYAAPAIVLLMCAGECGGADFAARRSAGSSFSPSVLAEPAPDIPPAPTPVTEPMASGPTAAKNPEAQPPDSPVRPLSFLADTAKKLASLYGACRNEGTWMFTAMNALAAQTLADPAATEKQRAFAEGRLEFHDSFLNGEGPIGTAFRVCGLLGPTEPPPWLATLLATTRGPRPSPPPASADEDATAPPR